MENWRANEMHCEQKAHGVIQHYKSRSHFLS